MTHLIKYESLDIDKFKDFISKYKKSDYISKSSIRKMGEIGLEYNNFKKIHDDVYKCYKFFKKNDTDLLDDILQDSKDENPIVFINYVLMLGIRSNPLKSFGDLDKFEISVTDKNNNIRSEKDIIDVIISNISTSREVSINKFKKDVDESKQKRPGTKDFFSEIRYKSLLRSDSFSKVEMIPIVLLRVRFKLDIDRRFEDDDYSWNSPVRLRFRQVKDKFKNDITNDEAVGRYLRAIGFPDCMYSINEYPNSDFCDTIDYKIEVILYN